MDGKERKKTKKEVEIWQGNVMRCQEEMGSGG